ncbi:hypothetical protein [Actinoplanes xinjiangensis]|uniref:hypothetical protein n=1 Tax=Actinoplanes xinjiangensis TaxID=512350 RepID=UPI003421BA54
MLVRHAVPGLLIYPDLTIQGSSVQDQGGRPACATDGAYPTSADIRAIVTYALGHGWNPELSGPGFMLSERAHATRFALPGFLLTDRLRTPDSGDPTLRVINFHEAHTNA